MMRFSSGRYFCSVLALLSFVSPAASQIQFIDSDNFVIDSNLSGYDVVVGANLVSPFTVLIESNAFIDQNNFQDDGFDGLEVFNNATIQMNDGGVSTATVHNNGIYNIQSGILNRYIGLDNSQLIINNGTASFNEIFLQGNATGSLIGTAIYANFFSTADSATLYMSGSPLPGGGRANGNSKVTLTETTGFGTLTIHDNATLEANGGALDQLVAVDQGAVEVHDALFNGAIVAGGASLSVTGSNLAVQSSDGLTGSYVEGKNYLGQNLTLTGIVGANASLSAQVFAGGYTVDSNLASFTGAGLAPDLYVLEDGVNTGVYNSAFTGRNEDNSVQGDPIVSLNDLDTVYLTTSGASQTTLLNGTVRESTTVDAGTRLEAVQSGQHLVTVNGEFVMNGGQADQVFVSGLMIHNGNAGSIELFSGAQFTMNAGSVSSLLTRYDSIASIRGGNQGFVEASSSNALTIQEGNITQLNVYTRADMFGGFVQDVNIYDGGIFNLYGGTIGSSTLNAFGNALINFFGLDLAFTNATVGIAGGQTGVFYDLIWTRSDGNTVQTRFFDAGGSVDNTTPNGYTFTLLGGSASAPEPGALPLLFVALPLLIACWKRSTRKLSMTEGNAIQTWNSSRVIQEKDVV